MKQRNLLLPTNPSVSILLQILRTRVPDAILLDRKQAITLGQTRAIINLTDPRLRPPLLQTQPRRARMRNNIAPNRLLRIRIKHGAGPPIHLRHHLIRDHDRDPKLIRQPLQRAHELRQMGLS